MREKGIMILAVLMALILCGPVSAMYSYTPEQLSSKIYNPGKYEPVTPYTSHDYGYISEEEWNDLKAGGGSINVQDYVSRLPSRPQGDVAQDGSDSPNTDSSQGTSEGSSTSEDASVSAGSSVKSSSAGNDPLNTTMAGVGAQAAGESGKANESTAGTQNSDDTPWSAYAVVGIISSLVFAGVAFFFKGSLLGK